MLRLARFFIAVIVIAHLLLSPQASSAQSEISKTYNDQGCAAMAGHDYERAKKLFTDALAVAEKAHDLKRTKTAADNLAALYSAQGRTAEQMLLLQGYRNL